MKTMVSMGKGGLVCLLFAAALTLAGPPAPASAATYRFVRIHQETEPYRCGLPKLNNRGEVVWVREKTGDLADRAVFLYSEGQVGRLSPVGKSSVNPDINDQGEVVWHNWYYEPNEFNPRYEQCLYNGGQITLIEKGMFANLPPLINSQSQVLYPTDGDGMLRNQFWLFDHGTKTPITDGANIDENYALNDLGDVAWVRTTLEPDTVYLNGAVIASGASGTGYYVIKINNLGQVLYTKEVNYRYDLMLFDGQQNILIWSNTQAAADWADLNDLGQVAYTVRESTQSDIYLYDQGISTKITPPGCTSSEFARINNRGQVVMVAYTPKPGGINFAKDFWIYEAGSFTNVTHEKINIPVAQFPQFNGRGQIACRVGSYDIYLATPVTLPYLPTLLLE